MLKISLWISLLVAFVTVNMQSTIQRTVKVSYMYMSCINHWSINTDNVNIKMNSSVSCCEVKNKINTSPATMVRNKHCWQ